MKILTCDSSLESAMLLRDKICRLTGTKIVVTKNPDSINGNFIRYGYSAEVDCEDTKHNSAKFIRLVANKYSFSDLIRKNSFYTPDFIQDTRKIVFPCLIRHTLRSYDGRGIVICQNQKEFDANWDEESFWTPFIKTDFELRVHVLGGNVRKIYKKVKRDELPEGKFPIRNLRLGYRYSLREIEAYPKVVKLVNQLHPVLNGSFYTLDIGWDSKNKEYFIFEANSGSGLCERTAEMYADYLVSQSDLKF